MIANGRFIGGFVAGAVFLALLVSLAGCGGGGSATASSEPLTKAQFIKRAEAICESEEERKEAKLKAASKLGEKYLGGSHKELGQLVAVAILPLYKEMIGEMATLNPPAGDETEVKQLVERYEKTLEKAEADPGKEVVSDSFVKTNIAAEKYGIKNCTL